VGRLLALCKGLTPQGGTAHPIACGGTPPAARTGPPLERARAGPDHPTRRDPPTPRVNARPSRLFSGSGSVALWAPIQLPASTRVRVKASGDENRSSRGEASLGVDRARSTARGDGRRAVHHFAANSPRPQWRGDHRLTRLDEAGGVDSAVNAFSSCCVAEKVATPPAAPKRSRAARAG
jgi:hypothetical protein